MPKCFLCKKTKTSVNGLFMHFDFKHRAHLFRVFKCSENGCYRQWSLRNSLRKHLVGPHHNFPAWSTIKSTHEHRIDSNNTKIFNKCINQVNTRILIYYQ